MNSQMNNTHKLTRKLNATYQGKCSLGSKTKGLTMFAKINFSRQRSVFIHVVQALN